MQVLGHLYCMGGGVLTVYFINYVVVNNKLDKVRWNVV